MQVNAVILATDQKKQISKASIRSAKRNGCRGSAKCEKGILEHVWLLMARVEERDAAWQRGGAQFLTVAQGLQQVVWIKAYFRTLS